jgi:hypothetical protein
MTSDGSPVAAAAHHAAANNALYLQLALTAGGNLLALAVIGVAWQCWKILSDFRAALLWYVLARRHAFYL